MLEYSCVLWAGECGACQGPGPTYTVVSSYSHSLLDPRRDSPRDCCRYVCMNLIPFSCFNHFILLCFSCGSTYFFFSFLFNQHSRVHLSCIFVCSFPILLELFSCSFALFPLSWELIRDNPLFHSFPRSTLMMMMMIAVGMV